MALLKKRQPHGRRVQCAGGFRAYVPGPLPPPIAWSAELASETRRNRVYRATAILEILEGSR